MTDASLHPTPDEVAQALWAQSQDRKLYKTWADVPDNVRQVWRGSYEAFAGALSRAGFAIVRVSADGSFQ